MATMRRAATFAVRKSLQLVSLACVVIVLATSKPDFLLPLHASCDSFSIEPKTWKYKSHVIGYDEARRLLKGDDNESDASQRNEVLRGGSSTRRKGDEAFGHKRKESNENIHPSSFVPSTSEDEKDPVLLLNGFGVGSFHQHRLVSNMLDLEEEEDVGDKSNNQRCRARSIYCVDYLGQGKSWPVDCNDGNAESELGLRYCINTWADQVVSFMEEVIVNDHKRRTGNMEANVRIHLVGNSVGGHLAAALALKRPDLVKSICLLNATPVWGLNLPGWSGHLPPPLLPRKIGRYLFDRIRDENTIEKYLEAAYANRDAFGDDLVQQIRACTEGEGGHAAFASILWSPRISFPEAGPLSFSSMLSRIECDVLLAFGNKDPWCKPAFARKMMKALDERRHDNCPAHRYVELDNVGHCPNHESPKAVAVLLHRWLEAEERGKDQLTLVDGRDVVMHEPWGEVRMWEVDGEEESISWRDRVITMLVG